jgi:MinD superfamily P-loop ATPase
MTGMKKEKKYRHIVFLSGKGGTGKTSFTASFSQLLNNKVIVDCDVDAANLYLLLNPEIKNEKEFTGGNKARIDEAKCNRCGLCEDLCRFDAIKEFKVDSISCEGCGLCHRTCPENAIGFEPHVSGSFYEGELEDGSDFYYAKLLPGEGNSGRLVSEIKETAIRNMKDETEWLLVDGPPGIGCPVNASLAGADFVVIITEPTLSGLHDLERLIELLKSFRIPFGVIINKHDINISVTEKIIGLTIRNESSLLGMIKFDRNFVDALQNGKTILEFDKTYKNKIKSIWSGIEIKVKN